MSKNETTTTLAPDLEISKIVTGLWQIADMEREGQKLDPDQAARHMQTYTDAGLTTFDLADQSKMSLSFYGKRPGPGMKLEKLSMQFSPQETEYVDDVLEAYERLILDAMRGDHTLFTTAQGIESLWERSAPLLVDPPPVKMYQPGTWGPNAIHQLIAPHAWRLPFERVWREKKP